MGNSIMTSCLVYNMLSFTSLFSMTFEIVHTQYKAYLQNKHFIKTSSTMLKLQPICTIKHIPLWFKSEQYNN